MVIPPLRSTTSTECVGLPTGARGFTFLDHEQVVLPRISDVTTERKPCRCVKRLDLCGFERWRRGGGPHPMGDAQNQPFQLSFNPRLRIEFQGSRVTSDGGLILARTGRAVGLQRSDRAARD